MNKSNSTEIHIFLALSLRRHFTLCLKLICIFSISIWPQSALKYVQISILEKKTNKKLHKNLVFPPRVLPLTVLLLFLSSFLHLCLHFLNSILHIPWFKPFILETTLITLQTMLLKALMFIHYKSRLHFQLIILDLFMCLKVFTSSSFFKVNFFKGTVLVKSNLPATNGKP